MPFRGILDKLKMLAHVNLMRPKEDKCYVPHLGQCHPEYQYKMGVKGLRAAC